jgi:hypothetical protein
MDDEHHMTFSIKFHDKSRILTEPLPKVNQKSLIT